MKGDDSRQRFERLAVKSIPREVQKFPGFIESDLFTFATLDEIERSFLSFARFLGCVRVSCTSERCWESEHGMDLPGLDSTWGVRDFCGSSKLDGFQATGNMRKSLRYAARVARARIPGICGYPGTAEDAITLAHFRFVDVLQPFEREKDEAHRTAM